MRTTYCCSFVSLTASACKKPLCAESFVKTCRYLGQQNPTDMFTRLLASLVYTGVAPQSFYKDPTGPDRHYDGM